MRGSSLKRVTGNRTIMVDRKGREAAIILLVGESCSLMV